MFSISKVLNPSLPYRSNFSYKQVNSYRDIASSKLYHSHHHHLQSVAKPHKKQNILDVIHIDLLDINALNVINHNLFKEQIILKTFEARLPKVMNYSYEPMLGNFYSCPFALIKALSSYEGNPYTRNNNSTYTTKNIPNDRNTQLLKLSQYDNSFRLLASSNHLLSILA